MSVVVLCAIVVNILLIGHAYCDGRVDLLPPIDPIGYVKFGGELFPLKVPSFFDWRVQLGPNGTPCTRPVLNSDQCAGTWALATTSAASDRACLNGIKSVFSPARVLSCCVSCGAGCYGGYPWLALQFLKNIGTAEALCQPLPQMPAEVRARTPKCRMRKCLETDRKYVQIKISDFYAVKNIESEIFKNGPVISYMNLHWNFLSYKGGIYQQTSAPQMGRVTVKLIGWGEEDNVKYWLGEGSWGPSWGLNGYFKILRGTNLANIEQYVFAPSFSKV